MAKFTISGTQFRTVKKDLVLDIIDDKGEIQKDTVVGWVTLRGEDDPVYQKRAAPSYIDYREELEIIKKDIQDLKDQAEKDKVEDVDLTIPQDALRKIYEKFLCDSVIAAIEDWDSEFFEGDFSPEKASEIFTKIENNHIYNQLALFMKGREDFLPLASA